MKRFLTFTALCLMSGAALADTTVSGDLEKDYMKFYCVYESNLYSLGSDMCSADGQIQVCAYDDKQSARPTWKNENKPCAGSTGE